jgi:hypothetical protein
MKTIKFTTGQSLHELDELLGANLPTCIRYANTDSQKLVTAYEA